MLRLDAIQCTTALEVKLLAELTDARKQLSRVKPPSEPQIAPVPVPEPPNPVPESVLQPCALNAPPDRTPAGMATMKQIQLAVCDRFNISPAELRSHRRQAYLLSARQTACMLIRCLTSKSYPEIGRAFGNKDHSTILHAARKYAPLHDRLISDLTPQDTLATWVKHAYNLVMREHITLARPKAPKPANPDEIVVNIAAERVAYTSESVT